MVDINRIIDSFRRIIRSEFHDYEFKGVYEYAIQSISGNKINADPTDTTLNLPSISNIELRSGILGETVKPTVGKLVLVVFVNSQKTRPVVVSCEGNNEQVEIDATSSIKLAGGGPPAARMGDAILAAGIFAGTITSGSTKTQIGG